MLCRKWKRRRQTRSLWSSIVAPSGRSTGWTIHLNFDPSHLVWLDIDPVAAVRPYLDRVLHAQAKDVQVDANARNRFGFFGRTVERSGPWDVGWWRYRVPGRGDIDWRAVIDALDEGGFTGTLSIEHEDPVWGGTPARFRQGLQIASATLRPLLGPVTPPG